MGSSFSKIYTIECEYRLKPGSQYNGNVTLRQEVIQFSMGLVVGIEMISIPATVASTNPLKMLYCEPGLREV